MKNSEDFAKERPGYVPETSQGYYYSQSPPVKYWHAFEIDGIRYEFGAETMAELVGLVEAKFGEGWWKDRESLVFTMEAGAFPADAPAPKSPTRSGIVYDPEAPRTLHEGYTGQPIKMEHPAREPTQEAKIDQKAIEEIGRKIAERHAEGYLRMYGTPIPVHKIPGMSLEAIREMLETGLIDTEGNLIPSQQAKERAAAACARVGVCQRCELPTPTDLLETVGTRIVCPACAKEAG